MGCIVSTSKVKPFRLIEVPNTKPTIDVVTIEGSIFRVTTAPDTLAQEYALVLPGTEILVLTQVLHSGYPANMQIRFSSPGPLE